MTDNDAPKDQEEHPNPPAIIDRATGKLEARLTRKVEREEYKDKTGVIGPVVLSAPTVDESHRMFMSDGGDSSREVVEVQDPDLYTDEETGQ